ncbi:MAG: Eco57I restriction-modification methylase domain-containing protein [Saprospiraceae bacterium]|nr:Eco57I restriction-modification methylase domain-containing protein [Saprospiraceae bacterium]
MIIDGLINNLSRERVEEFFTSRADRFRILQEDYSEYTAPEERFGEFYRLGEIETEDGEEISVFLGKVEGSLLRRSSRMKQFEIIKKIIKADNIDGAIVIFYGENGHFRFSFIKVNYLGSRREFSTYKRYSFYIEPDKANKTFRQQIIKTDFSSIDNILKAFSIEEVSSDFYNEFKPHFDRLVSSVTGDHSIDQKVKEEFALLFVIRLIFIGFVQKREWLGGRKEFVLDFWSEYKEYRSKNNINDEFYQKWLEPLFFEAFCNAPGRKVMYGANPFSKEVEDILQMAPYLNGGLFERIRAIDDKNYYIPDKEIEEFVEFLFQYNFTVEENTRYDEELELNPEFLGIIFEKLINKEMGAVYTPRTEVDLMCRLAISKWLEKHVVLEKEKLYKLIFGVEEERASLELMPEKIVSINHMLERVQICDPAAGSGAFEVGMLQVIDELMEFLGELPRAPLEIKESDRYLRKRKIISRSLYGVEVKQWAVWINQLRLWLTLFIEMPDEEKNSVNPLLPSLNFKVCQGDSLVQMIGGKLFPVQEINVRSRSLKMRIKSLIEKKKEFFENQIHDLGLIKQEEKLIFQGIIDEEIDEIRGRIRRERIKEKRYHSDKRTGQQDIFNTEETFQEQIELNEQISADIKAGIDSLEEKIKELEEEKKQIEHNEYFIWNLEFAEIFSDKGGFDIIIGNPPYLRHEKIEDPLSRMDKSDYKMMLQEVIENDYKGYFKNIRGVQIRKINHKSDLYTYFYLHTLNLLNTGGVHCFICSNSWLDVGYGAWMQEFLLNKVRIHLIIDNQAKRSFAGADINTVITLMDKQQSGIIDDTQIGFIGFRKLFDEIISADNMTKIHETIKQISNNNYRVLKKSSSELIHEGIENNTYIGGKWYGKYLNSPDWLLSKMINKELDYLNDKVVIKYGVKLGSVGFFIPNNVTINKYNINHHLTPLFKDSKVVDSYIIKSPYLSLAFNPINKDKYADSYIKYGEAMGINERKSLQGKIRWYNYKEIKSKIIIPQFYYTRFFSLFSKIPICFTNNFWGIVDFKDIDEKELFLFLNSTFLYYQLELFGRKNLGEGLLTVYGPELKSIIIPTNLFNFDHKDLYDSFIHRKINNIFIELGINPKDTIRIEEQEPNPLPDRKVLDDIVFDALGLTEEERKDVYRAVCQLVWDRLSKARSVE